MRKLLAAAVVAALASAPAAAKTDFDQGVSAREAAARARAAEAAVAPAPAVPAAEAAKSSVWVSFSRADLASPKAKGFPLSGPVLSDGSSAVFQVPAGELPSLSRFMHSRFKRCGGFFALRTRAEARASMTPRAERAAGPYTLDQQAFVRPLLSKISEPKLRATIQTLSAYHDRYYSHDQGVASAQWIADRWTALAAKIPGAAVRLYRHDGWKQPSVILTVPGTDKADEIVVLGGHLDSINIYDGRGAAAPGADDNASGIAVLTEAIRVLADGGFRPRRTVEFMGYAAEEVGLRGSQDIADDYARQGKKVVGVIQYDMSNFPGNGPGMFLLTDNVDPELSAFTGKLIDAYAGVPRGTTECGYACSDHASWTRAGYPSAMAFEATLDTMNENLHTDHDTLANGGGDASHSVPFARLAVAFAAELAKTAPRAAQTAAR
jgi:leucyl aminopeptidase